MHISLVEDQVLFVSSFEKKINVSELAPLHVRDADHDTSGSQAHHSGNLLTVPLVLSPSTNLPTML